MTGAPHTLADQLALMRETHKLELMLLKRRQSQDQADIETAFDTDQSWSGQHARLKTGKGLDDVSSEP